MKVAELSIICGRHAFAGAAAQGLVGFSSLESAKAEFDRMADLLKRREDRKNDLEKTVVIKGIGEFSCCLDDITCVGLSDFAHLNEQEAGVRDTFPNIFKR